MRAVRCAPLKSIGCEILGQIPAMFNLEWMLKDYARHDLSSLQFAAYGGQCCFAAISGPAGRHGAGDRHRAGATEAAGFCTYMLARRADSPIRRRFSPGSAWICRFIRARFASRCARTAMAGDELPSGEIGHVCFRGPQTFLGYVNDPEATAKAISRDGYLYTGDLGFKMRRGCI